MTPREKADACFRKARSTTSEHERDNAITLGTRIAEKANLDLDLFDIPGRERKAPPRPEAKPHWSRDPHARSPNYARYHEFGGYDRYQRERAEREHVRTTGAEAEAMLKEAIARMQEQARRAREKAKPRPLYPTAESAAAFLRTVDAEVRVMPHEPGSPRRWTLIHGGKLYAGIADEALIEGALAVTPEHIKAAHDASERKRMAADLRWSSVFYGVDL